MRFGSALIAMLIGFTLAVPAHASSAAFEAAKKIAGRYTGSWTMYGIENDTVVQKAAWTDVLNAENPTEAKDRAFVQVTDVMKFSDGATRTSKFNEGFIANSNGSIGDRFFDFGGAITFFKKMTENDWVYQATPAEGELRMLGFDPKSVISASHVATKTTTYEGTIDTDHVIRVTTVQWKDVKGIVKSKQFVSMQGTHTRSR